MKALATGATGFIGSHLVEALLQKGVSVRCLLRKTSDLKWLRGLPVEVVLGDCRDKASLGDAVKEVDQVFHLAGVTKAVEDRTYFEVNGQGTDNLIHACVENTRTPPRFIYLSSQAAAGPCRNGGRKCESDQCEPVSAYGQSKRMGEELAMEHVGELPLLILRPSAVYGPRDRDIYTFFKLLSRRINLRLTGQDQHISLCYVQDVVQAILLAAGVREPTGEIFFLSDGHDYRMEEIGDIFATTMGIKAFSIPVPEWALSGAASLSHVLSKFTGNPPLLSKGKVEEMIQRNWVCDITKARTLLGFSPGVPLADGAKLTFDWYRKEKWL